MLLALVVLAIAQDPPTPPPPVDAEECASAREELERLLAVVRERLPEAALEVDSRPDDTGDTGTPPPAPETPQVATPLAPRPQP